MKEIEITVDKDGKVEIDMHGWQGKGCHKIAADLAKDLGKITKVKKKSEFYKPVIEEKQKIRRGT